MGDIEPVKPSNTGWLIADVVQDTSAFGWSRTEVDPGLLRLLADPQWQPCVVFPGEYADTRRVVEAPAPTAGKRPLFVLLDGTWSEARKMFRKEPLPGQLAGAQPAARATVDLPAAPLHPRRPPVHLRGGGGVPGSGGRRSGCSPAASPPGPVHAALPAGQATNETRLARPALPAMAEAGPGNTRNRLQRRRHHDNQTIGVLAPRQMAGLGTGDRADRDSGAVRRGLPGHSGGHRTPVDGQGTAPRSDRRPLHRATPGGPARCGL